MHTDFLLSPILQYTLEVVGIGLCLYLFFTLKREARTAGLQGGGRLETVESALEDLRASLGDMKARLGEMETRTGTLVPAPSAMNLNRRSLALRMCRRGESAEQIAASLALPRKEVELLVRIHRITAAEK